MAWRIGEVWLDTEVSWFREPAFGPAGALGLPELPRFGPAETGLAASRRRRYAAQAARRRRFTTRTVPAVALVAGSSLMLPVAALRQRGAAQALPLPEDPPSLTFHVDDFSFRLPEPAPEPTVPEAPAPPTVEWQTATSVGLWYAGHLVDGTQLPVEGPDWVTWNPNTDSTPNLPRRLYGNERTIRTILEVIGRYRAAHPNAPRVVVGDISLRGGGRMDQHASHQNGLDVDVYYPRLDRRLGAPISTRQVDRRLSQELLDGFLDAGARMVFVGYASGLRGPGGVVVPYPNHENHMHVRFRLPSG